MDKFRFSGPAGTQYPTEDPHMDTHEFPRSTSISKKDEDFSLWEIHITVETAAGGGFSEGACRFQSKNRSCSNPIGVLRSISATFLRSFHSCPSPPFFHLQTVSSLSSSFFLLLPPPLPSPPLPPGLVIPAIFRILFPHASIQPSSLPPPIPFK